MAFTARTETHARGSSLTSPYNFTINKAGGVVDGDIMFMFLHIYISSPPTIDSVPSGWTQVATNATGNNRWYLFYKIASSEGTSYTWSLTGSCRYYALNIAYSSGDFKVSSISDITGISNTLYGTAGTTIRAASINVPDANSPLVYFASVYNTTVRTFTKPTSPTSDWVEDADEGHTTPDLSLTIGSMVWGGYGNTGNIDIDCSTRITTNKHAFVISLKPPTVGSSDGVSSATGVLVGRGGLVSTINSSSLTSGDLSEAITEVKGYIHNWVLGPEKIINGTFDSSSSWETNTGWSIGSGRLNADNVALGVNSNQNASISAGLTYRLSFDISNYSNGAINFLIGAQYGVPNLNFSSNGSYSYNLVSQAINSYLYVRAVIGVLTASIDNISLKEANVGCIGSSLVTGVLRAKALLSTFPVGSSSFNVTIKAIGILSSDIQTQSVTEAYLLGITNLVGVINVSPIVHGTLTAIVNTSVQVSGVSSVSGYISSSGIFSGSSIGLSIVTSYIRGISKLSVNLLVKSTVYGALLGSTIGISSGVSTVSCRIIAFANLQITCSGNSSIVGLLKARGKLVSDISFGTSISSIIYGRGLLITNISGLSTGVSLILGRGSLSAVALGSSDCIAVPILLTQVGRSYGYSMVSGSIGGKVRLAGVINNINTSIAILRGKGALGGDLIPITTVQANLRGICNISTTLTPNTAVYGLLGEYEPPYALFAHISGVSGVTGRLWDASKVYREFTGSVTILDSLDSQAIINGVKSTIYIEPKIVGRSTEEHRSTINNPGPSKARLL